MRMVMKERVSSAQSREMGLWTALLMLLGQHLFSGGLQNGHVASSIGGGLGIWLVFRYFAGPARAGKN